MRRVTFLVILCLGLALAPASHARELHDITLPDTITVGEESLILNGMGLRKKAFIKVYVAGLYLSTRASDPAAILEADGPRRIVMAFKFGVGAEKMCDAWQEGLDKNTPSASADVEAKFEVLCSYMEDLDKGDQLVATYVPALGTEIVSKGVSKGTIEGKAFADALLACWLGPEPPGEDLKIGLLGG